MLKIGRSNNLDIFCLTENILDQYKLEKMESVSNG